MRRLLAALTIAFLVALVPSPASAGEWANCDGVSRLLPGDGLVLNFGMGTTPWGWGSHNNNTLLIAGRGVDNAIYAQPIWLGVGGYGDWVDGRWYNLGGLTYGAPVVFGYVFNGRTYTDIYVQGVDGNLYVNQDTDGRGWTGWRNLGTGVGFGDSTGPETAGNRSYRLSRPWYNPLGLEYRCR